MLLQAVRQATRRDDSRSSDNSDNDVDLRRERNLTRRKKKARREENENDLDFKIKVNRRGRVVRSQSEVDDGNLVIKARTISHERKLKMSLDDIPSTAPTKRTSSPKINLGLGGDGPPTQSNGFGGPRVPCRFGLNCMNKFCRFYHPERANKGYVCVCVPN